MFAPFCPGLSDGRQELSPFNLNALPFRLPILVPVKPHSQKLSVCVWKSCVLLCGLVSNHCSVQLAKKKSMRLAYKGIEEGLMVSDREGDRTR